jgi:hypothetical protein
MKSADCPTSSRTGSTHLKRPSGSVLLLGRSLLIALACASSAPCLSQVTATVMTSDSPSVVKVERTGSGFQLIRNGKPYLVKGAGGYQYLDLLVSSGGNSIRTWGTDNLGQILDDAEQKGLTVTAGIWLQHQDGMNYHDSAAVAKQLEMCRDVVRKYKNYPALLVWAFGNEEEGDGKDPAVFKAVNDIAAMAHQEDPNHPAMTVMAEIGRRDQS